MVLMICVTRGESQQKRLDSLFVVYHRHPQEDSIKASNLKNIFRQYRTLNNWAKFRLYADSAIIVASKLANKSSLASIHNRIGAAYHMVDRLQAIANYNTSIELAKLSGDKSTEAGSSLNLGALYMDLHEYPKSLEAHEKALTIYEGMGKSGEIPSVYMNIATIYTSMGQKAKGLEYTRKALAGFDNGVSDRGVAVAYDAIAELYLESTDKELAEMGILPANRFKEVSVALEKGLRVARQTDDISLLSGFYRNLGRLNEQRGNNAEASKYYLMSVNAIGDDISLEDHGDNLIAAGNFTIHKAGDFTKGIGMIHSALDGARKTQRTGTIEAALDALSSAHEKKKNFDSSLFYYRQLIVVKNDIFNHEKEQEITRRQLKMDFAIKEKDYRSAQQLADARLKQQEQQILLRSQQLQISDKEKTLQRLTFLQRQAELESQKKAQANLLIRAQEKAGYDKLIRDKQIDLQNLQLNANRRLTIFLGLVAFIVFASAIFIYNSRQKTIRLNKTVSDQKQALEELISVKDRIFSVVSHDMKAPVNNLIAFSALLEDGEIEQERLALYIEQIRGTLDHTSSLMDNLLNWAASQMQGFTPVIEKVDLGAVVRYTLKGVEQPLRKKNIAVINHVEKGTFIKGDKNMIELIVRNLVSNAIKFSQEGGTLELAGVDTGSTIKLTVRDQGVGMPENKVALINGNSAKSLESTYGTHREKGTGLGLMLCKHFASIMGGQIAVSSQQGKGTEFQVLLPAAA